MLLLHVAVVVKFCFLAVILYYNLFMWNKLYYLFLFAIFCYLLILLQDSILYVCCEDFFVENDFYSFWIYNVV